MRTGKTKNNQPPKRAIRRLKISYCHVQRGGLTHWSRRTERIPQLRLQGKWLQQLGFHPNALVHVTGMEGLLIISNIV